MAAARAPDSRDSLFGTDGIRGRVGEEPITPHTVLKLGWAAGRVLVAADGGDGDGAGAGTTGAAAGSGDSAAGTVTDPTDPATPDRPRIKVLIGKDTRVSGYLLESALEAGFSAAGVNVCLLGPLPTPAIAYLTRTARAAAGVVISASHNPYPDNGVKFFGGDGAKLPDEITARIDAMMDAEMTCVDSARLGKAERLTDAQGRYIEFCKNTLPPARRFSGMKLVVDCAHGAAYEVAPRVFAEMGAEVTAIGNRPDGFNINRACGSTNLDALAAKVAAVGADAGIALDGDADRVLLVDRDGARVDGDQILYILARRRQEEGNLGGGVVGTVMTNLGLERALAKLKIRFARAAVGDRHVRNLLLANRWQLGGESSGHILCLDKSPTGDGIIAALEALEVMQMRGRSLRELVADMPVYPQRLRNVPVAAGRAGTPGLAAKPGKAGAPGKSGKSGMAGKPGEAGMAGKPGMAGVAGKSGVAEMAGESGMAEMAGESGMAGESEVAGMAGKSGMAGMAGMSGVAGTARMAGAAGVAGGRPRARDIAADKRVTAAARAAEAELTATGHGRVVLRPSGTEPVVRILVEGEDPNQVERLAESLANTVASAAE